MDSSASADSLPLNPDIEMDLEQQLKLNHEIIQTKYAAYVHCICTILEDKDITARQLTTYLLYLPALTKTADKGKMQLLMDMKAELQKAEKITDIFISLSTRYHSFLDYNIFKKILKQFGSNEIHEDLDYPTHLKDYIEMHKIKEFVKLFPELDNPKLQKIDHTSTVVSNIKGTESLSTLEEVKGVVANILGLKASALRLYSVKKGCVLGMFLISTSIADTIFTSETVFTEEQEERFRAASVLWFECNGRKYDFRKRNENDQTHDSASGNVCSGMF